MFPFPSRRFVPPCPCPIPRTGRRSPSDTLRSPHTQGARRIHPLPLPGHVSIPPSTCPYRSGRNGWSCLGVCGCGEGGMADPRRSPSLGGSMPIENGKIRDGQVETRTRKDETQGVLCETRRRRKNHVDKQRIGGTAHTCWIETCDSTRARQGSGRRKNAQRRMQDRCSDIRPSDPTSTSLPTHRKRRRT